MTLPHYLSVAWVCLLDIPSGGMVDTVDWRNRMANLVYGVPYEEKQSSGGGRRGSVDVSKPPPSSTPPSNIKDKLAVLFADVPEPDSPAK